MGRASSVAVEASSLPQDWRSSRVMFSSAPAPDRNKRWSSVMEYSTTTTRGRGRTPTVPTYTDALIKSSQILRERSMSPPPVVQHEKVSPYHCNMDYYRGKVKSVYEKEPYFKDFVRNIPLSETNVYDMNNLSRLKKRFNSIVQDKWGRKLLLILLNHPEVDVIYTRL